MKIVKNNYHYIKFNTLSPGDIIASDDNELLLYLGLPPDNSNNYAVFNLSRSYIQHIKTNGELQVIRVNCELHVL